MKNIKSLVILFLLTFQITSYASVGSMIDDTAITAKIKSEISLNTNLSVFKVGVSTNKGTVILSGTIDSETHAATLIQLVQSTEGVKDIDISHLRIRDSVHPFSDGFITAKVKGMFIKKRLFGTNEIPDKISVETRNSIVYLKGDLDNKAQGAEAISIARHVKGVASVDYHFNYKY